MGKVKIDDRHLEVAGKVAEHPINLIPYARVSDPLRGNAAYEAWPHIIEFLQVAHEAKSLVVIKARQIGLSWASALYALWTAMYRPNARVLLISIGEREAGELLAKSKYIWRYLPGFLKPTLNFDSVTMLGFEVMESKIVALPNTAYAGKGEAGTLVINDEWDFHEFAAANYASAKPTVDRGDAKVIGVTTVDKTNPNSFSKQIFRGAIVGENNFKALFYPYDILPWRDEAWYEQTKRDSPEPWRMEENYPRTIGEALSPLSERSFFDKDALNYLWDNAEEPIDKRAGGIYILQPPKVGIRYVGGVDVAKGVRKDFSSLTIIGKEGIDAEVVAVINTNDTSTDMFAYQVDKLCREYFNPLLAVENNGIAEAVLNKLRDLHYPRIYDESKDGKSPGVATTAGAMSNFRLTNLVELGENIRNRSVRTKFKPQIQQMMEFYWKEGVVRDRPEGKGHDDMVFSLMFANLMLKHARGPVAATVVYT